VEYANVGIAGWLLILIGLLFLAVLVLFGWFVMKRRRQHEDVSPVR
jgi:HAMP domain-containing protein